MLTSVTFEVTGEQKMACQGCEQRVVRLLGGLQGVTEVHAQARNQRIEVRFDPATVEVSAAAKVLKEAGYETMIVE